MAHMKDFGWWIESADEETYGPVTVESLQEFLQDGVISANTIVRHCTEVEGGPIVDKKLLGNVDPTRIKRSGDTLAEDFPKRTRERLALAESDIECAYHRRPAVLTCIRCQAPYCSKCQLKKKNVPVFMCKKCQNSMFNRRFGAFMVDGMLINFLPQMGIAVPLIVVLGPDSAGAAAANALISIGSQVVYVVRDSLMGGAGPGKRIFGVRVVKHADGVSPPSHGQAFVRWLGHLIPIFSIFDAVRISTDPFARRYGDGWAKTRVLDSEKALEKLRQKVRNKLEAKDIEFPVEGVMMSQDEFARTDG